MCYFMEEEYPLGTPQEHALICEKHNSYIDVSCEDCDEFMHTTFVKENHLDHEWNTLSTAANLKSEQFSHENIKKLDKKILRASDQIEDNRRICEIAVSRLQEYYDAKVETRNRIKQKHEHIMLNSLQRKNT